MIYTLKHKWGYIVTAIILSLVCLIGTGTESHAQGSCNPYTACASAGGVCMGNSSQVGIGVRFSGQPVGTVGGILGNWYYCSGPDPWANAITGYYMGPGWCIYEKDYTKDAAGGFFFYNLVHTVVHSYRDGTGSVIYNGTYGWLKHEYTTNIYYSVMLSAWRCY